jgi:hypothetical protein
MPRDRSFTIQASAKRWPDMKFLKGPDRLIPGSLRPSDEAAKNTILRNELSVFD